MSHPSHHHPEDESRPDTKTRIQQEVDRAWTTKAYRTFVVIMSVLGPLIIGVLLYAHRGYIKETITETLKAYVLKETHERDLAAINSSIQSVQSRIDSVERNSINSASEVRQGQTQLLQKISDVDRKLAVLEGKLDRSLNAKE